MTPTVGKLIRHLFFSIKGLSVAMVHTPRMTPIVGESVGRLGGRQYEVVVLDAEPKALQGGRYLFTLICAL